MSPTSPAKPSANALRTSCRAPKCGAKPILRGAFAVYGGYGTTASSTIVYEVEPGKRFGWHTDATEETQYIIAGTGKLYLEDGTTHQVGPGSVFVLPTPMRHELENTCKETLRAVAFFAAAMFMQGLREAHCLSQRPPSLCADGGTGADRALGRSTLSAADHGRGEAPVR